LPAPKLEDRGRPRVALARVCHFDRAQTFGAFISKTDFAGVGSLGASTDSLAIDGFRV
jgi:hypothetical protein